jgi:PAS domain S-box-containing protein
MTSRGRIRRGADGKPAHMTGVMFDITPAKRLEQELRESEARYREQATLLDLAHDAIFVRDPDSRITFWNRAAEEVYGWKTHEALGTVSHDLLRTKFPRTIDGLNRTLLAKGYWEGELTHTRRDGRELVVDSRWALRRDTQGKPTGVLEINRDITRRRRSEQALQEKQERLIAALEAAGAGTFRWNIVTNDLDWDEPLDRLFGLAPGVTIRSLENFVELVHPQDRSGVIERCRRCAAEGVDFEMEFRVIWPDKSEHWLYDRGKTILDAEGKPAYMTGACVDITDRKITEQRLRALETRERIILEHLPVGVWFVDSRGHIVYGNKVALEIWGGGRYVGTDHYGEYKGWWHHSGQQLTAEQWAAARAFRERTPFLNQLIDIVSFEGQRKTIMNSAAPVLLPNGEFEGVVVFNLDVTEQARMQAALRRSHDELETRVAERTAKLQETVEALEAFSYSISHDMRSPLRSMQGFADSLLKTYSQQLPAEAQDMLARIKRAAHRLDLLILDVLSYARVAKEPITLEPIELDPLLSELIANYPSFQKPNAMVTVQSVLG